MDISERLNLFYRMLEAAPPAASADEAMQMLCRLLEQVESLHCAVPREEPPPLRFTGRMYPPQPDRMRRLPNGAIVADSRRHRIVCQSDGSIQIIKMPDRLIVFARKGAEK